MRIFKGISNSVSVENIDGDSFRFHGPMKAMFYKIIRLINPPPKEWVDEIPGNIGVLKDIYYEYLENEKQAWRREIFIRVFPFSLCLANYDENYEEVVQWMLYRITQEHEKGRFTFMQHHKHPGFWFQDGRGRIGLTKENNEYVKEYLNGKSKSNHQE